MSHEAIAKFWKLLGGRKTAVGLLAFISLTAMAIPLGAGFMEYAGAVLFALGITSGSVAYEDRKTVRVEPRRASDPVRRRTDPPPEPEPVIEPVPVI